MKINNKFNKKRALSVLIFVICINMLITTGCKDLNSSSSDDLSSTSSSSELNSSSEINSSLNSSSDIDSSVLSSSDIDSSLNSSNNSTSSSESPVISPTDNVVKELSEKDIEELKELDNDAVLWGPGTRVDEDNRPETLDNFDKRFSKYGGVFSTKKESKNIILTFDLGYENGFTPKILDVLKEKGVKGVFFVTSPYAKGQPDLIKRIIDEGHILANHTVNHPAMPTISIKECQNEILDLHNYIKETYDYSMWLIRPPEGKFSIRTLELAKKIGYKTILWSFAYADWDPKNQPDPAKALEKVTKSAHSGGLYLLHAVSETNTKILGDVIDNFTKNNFTLSIDPLKN